MPVFAKRTAEIIDAEGDFIFLMEISQISKMIGPSGQLQPLVGICVNPISDSWQSWRNP